MRKLWVVIGQRLSDNSPPFLSEDAALGHERYLNAAWPSDGPWKALEYTPTADTRRATLEEAIGVVSGIRFEQIAGQESFVDGMWNAQAEILEALEALRGTT